MLRPGLSEDAHADSWTKGGDTCGMPQLFECDSNQDCEKSSLAYSFDIVLDVLMKFAW